MRPKCGGVQEILPHGWGGFERKVAEAAHRAGEAPKRVHATSASWLTESCRSRSLYGSRLMCTVLERKGGALPKLKVRGVEKRRGKVDREQHINYHKGTPMENGAN